MAKRKRESGKKQIEKKLKEGRGQGRLDQYKPWITVQDLASEGLVTRIKGTKTGRLHQLLSTLELNYFYILDWSQGVIDIREQYPLDLSETIALANEISVKHHTDPITQEEVVITTDFLITILQPIGIKEVARTIKYSNDLTDIRVLEKFEIERLYWKERNISWGIVTELDINKTLLANIKWLYRYRELSDLPPSINTSNISEISYFLYQIVKRNEIPLRNITNDSDKKFNLQRGNSLALVRYLIAIRKWSVEMLKPIQPGKILNFIKENSGGKTL